MQTITRTVTLAILLVNCFIAKSQEPASFEKSTFDLVTLGTPNEYNLFQAINYDKTVYDKGKAQIDAFVATLEAKNIYNKSLKKQIQVIYKSTHSRFLKKYDEKAFFPDIFQTGNYNCVTASALFALIFDRFNINYTIKETPSHVYLIADTLGLQTLIETTTPGTGAVIFNEKFKKDFVQYLNKNKLISDAEYNAFTTEELFRKYYSKDKSINKVQLAALQYYNKGVFLMQDSKYLGAVPYFEKALLLYPSNSVKYNHYAALQNALSEDYRTKQYNGRLFGQLIRSGKVDSSLKQLSVDYFNEVSVELCANNPDIDRYDKLCRDIQSALKRESLPPEIANKYHYYKAYYYAALNNYPKALLEVKKAYTISPDNLLTRELANELAVKHLLTDGRYKQQIDSLEYYFSELPFLFENKLMQQQYVAYYMKMVSDGFMYNEPQQGIAYLDRFNKVMDEREIQYLNEEHISAGYGVASYYYASNKDYSKALEILEEGLALVPASLRLKQAKRDLLQARSAQRNYEKFVADRSKSNHVVYYSEAEQLKDDINKYFPGKWKAVTIIMEDMEQKLAANEVFEFVAERNKNCTYTHNGKIEKGKWSYRTKSHCIYFVPNANKDDYKVFKVKEAGVDRIVLLPYKDQRRPSPYKYVLKPQRK